MKNTMNKAISFILVAILLLSATPLAYAEDSATYEVGDIIQFGSYPQSEVEDETLIAKLNARAPEWDEWTSYGYYSGNGNCGSMIQGDWMRYIDVEYNGNKYRGVKFTQYRPYYTYYNSLNYSYQDDNGYITDISYWFKFEPINWEVLDPVSGLVICETIIDAQAYCDTIYYNGDKLSNYAYFNDSLFKNFANDYENSSIRKWLNGDFYNTAFSDGQKNKIKSTALNNDGYYTLTGAGYDNRLDSKETNDKIFLLSYNEAKNVDFGFALDENKGDFARQTKGSDYAKSQGLYVESLYDNNSYWFLRSPGYYSSGCCGINYSGQVSSGEYFATCDVSRGVRPALNFKQIPETDQEHKHNYEYTITNPTCTTQGYTTYICYCGDKYVADYVVVLTHKDDNLDNECDYGCGHKFGTPIPDMPVSPDEHEHTYDNDKDKTCNICGFDRTDDCSCNCHAGGIKAFFFKIINFFQKLFGINKVCACGVKH